MEAKHVVTLVVGTAVALLLVLWALNELRRDWRERRRLPLVRGPFSGGTMFVGIGVIGAFVAVVYVIFTYALVPKGSPALFTATVGWVIVAFAFAILGGTTWQLRRRAAGWLTAVGENTLRLDADGGTTTLTLRPGAATLRLCEGGPLAQYGMQYVQLDVEDGAAAIHVWGMVGIRDFKLLSSGLVRAQGLMVGTSIGPLCRWLAPFIAKE